MLRESMGRKMMSRIVLALLLIGSIMQAKDYTIDASDKSKPIKLSIHMTICHAVFGIHNGLYIKSYQKNEKHKTCEELSPQFEYVTINPYSSSKRKSGNAGSIGFGKKPHLCSLELSNVNGKVTGTPYGDKAVCSGIRSEGTIILKKNAKQKEEPKVPHVIKILKYGSPHGSGRSFPSQGECEREKAKLSKANAGLDYSYKCVKK